MIGKPEWFTYRVLGWGVRPKGKEGLLYIAAWFVIMGIPLVLPVDSGLKIIAFSLAMTIFLADIMHIMILLPGQHDERENYHQLVIERNCSFIAIISIVTIMFLQIAFPGFLSMPEMRFDISLVVVLFAMAITKAGSTAYLRKKM